MDAVSEELYRLRAENVVLKSQLEAMTQERDNLAGIVWGKIRGAAPSLNMGGQASPQTACAMCGADCTADTPNFAYGSRYCSPCVDVHGREAVLEHSRGIMAAAGAAVVGKNNQPVHPQAKAPAMPPIAHPPVAVRNGKPFDPNTTDTQAVNRSEGDAWVASLTSGQKP